MISQHSNSLATATAAILVHNDLILRLCTKMAAISMAKGCMQTLYWGNWVGFGGSWGVWAMEWVEGFPQPAPCLRLVATVCYS